MVQKNDIREFGACDDGVTLNTDSIQAAINDAHRRDGGVVSIPSGTFLTGTLELKSGVELHLEKGACLLGSTDPRDYRELEMVGRPESPNAGDNSQLALIVAYRANDIAITGEGKIDGQGLELALAVNDRHHSGECVDPLYQTWAMRPHEKMRPKLIRISSGKNITLQDASFQAAACWGLSFELCENLTINSIKIKNRAYWNNDGIDLTDSTKVKIVNCDIDAADDGICLKSYYPGYFNEDVYIARNRIVSSASAIKLGTASSSGFKNVKIEDIEVLDTFRSAIAIESVDGGVIENVTVDNVVARNTGNALFIRLGDRLDQPTGSIRNVQIQNMKVEVPFLRPDLSYDLRAHIPMINHNTIPASITGVPGLPVEGVTLKNIEISYPGRATKGQAYVPLHGLDWVPEAVKDYPEFSMFGELPAWGLYVRHAKGIEMENIRLKLLDDDYRPAFVFDDVSGVTVREVQLSDGLSSPQFGLRNVSDEDLSGVTPSFIELVE